MLWSVKVNFPTDDFITAEVCYRSDPSLADVLAKLPKRIEPTYKTVIRRVDSDYPRLIPARVAW
jgi:hypothetical protein